MKKKPMIGGQAVIEGVMMKGPTRIATAVREPSGNIAVCVSSRSIRWEIGFRF